MHCKGSFLSSTRSCLDAPSRVRFRDIPIYYGTAFLALFKFKWRNDHLTKTFMRQTLFMEIADSRLHLSPMITHLDLHLMVLRKKFNISVIMHNHFNQRKTCWADWDNFTQRTSCRPDWENFTITTRLPGDRHAFWNCSIPASRRLTWRSNDGLSSMQKQTLKRSKSGSKFIHEQFPL